MNRPMSSHGHNCAVAPAVLRGLLLALTVVSVSGSTCTLPETATLDIVNVSHNAGRSTQPSCATDSSGALHLVWTDQSYSNYNEEILYSTKPLHGDWTEPVNVSNTPRPSRLPAIAVGPGNRLHMVWQDCSPDGHWRVFYATKPQGGDWSVPETLGSGSDFVDPVIAVVADGSVYVCWETGGFNSVLRAAKREPTSGWSPYETVTDSPFSSDQRIVCGAEGEVTVVYFYVTPDFGRRDVMFAERLPNGHWSLPEYVSTNGDAIGLFGAAMTADGTVHVAWLDDATEGCGSVYRARSPSGAWSAIESVPAHPWTGLMDVQTLCVPAHDSMLSMAGIWSANPGRGGLGVVYLLQKHGQQPWSDTLRVGTFLYDPYTFNPDVIARDGAGSLFMATDILADTSDLDNHDIFVGSQSTRR